MQTAKTRSSNTTSPSTMRTGRHLKISAAEKPNKDGNPRVVDRKSPPSPVLAPDQKKRQSSKVSELESQLSQINEELKKAKDYINSSESTKKRAQQEAEDAKKQLANMEANLDELSASEEARLQELRKISNERDRAWQSELEAVQKQHSMDSATLSSALNEIQKLKFHLERVSESEASQTRHAETAYAEIHNLRIELTETLVLVDKLKTQISNFNESEERALELLSRTQLQLEIAKNTEKTLRLESDQTIEAYKALSVELDQYKARVNLLEEIVTNLQAKISNGEDEDTTNPMKTELNQALIEVTQLRSALDLAEKRYQEEYIRSTLQIRTAYELVERTKSESAVRDSELETKLKMATVELEEINGKTKKKDEFIEELKTGLMEKETELQNIKGENEILKANNENLVQEREALIKKGCLELEDELRKLKVQSDQWRKAAEVAAAMLSTGNNGKFVERMGSIESYYNTTVDGKIGSPLNFEEMEDDSLKKKNGNMLKKFGVLLKKGQK
ncbi:interactor of constitutive active ROPs 2, chloroplastic-like [Impatiens glandulifera]|uniref:interactor of constitutive active ROPs 2, chloroplastic-like n=1 Tax=Impatiens glandulifera TaxID=253017 RepID=UPI001FB110C8|nr:interactor of constitutive active ROPs 2, chloroplastic-like [Impatiens glandulifera]